MVLRRTGDGLIDQLDFAVFAGSWYEQSGYIPTDFDDNGIIDWSNMGLLLNHFLSYPAWVFDDVTSLCIDAGDPNSGWTAELWPHEKRLNMGAYGGTPQASMSLSGEGNIANLDDDPFDTLDYYDLGVFVNKWCHKGLLNAEDLNRDGMVSFVDFAVFAANWLNEK